MGMDDRIADVQTIFRLAEKVLGSKETAQTWMQTPIPDLKGDTPQNHILTDKPDAFDNVKQILQRIEKGIYS